MPAYKRTVTVWDLEYEITVYQKSKTVWVATGLYMGKPIEVKDRSDSTAVAKWRDTARYWGNDPVPIGS